VEQPDRFDLARRPLHVSLTGLVFVGAMYAIALRVYEPLDSHDGIAIATALAGAALVLHARYLLGLRWLSAPVIYLMLMWMFHFGMTFTAVLAPSVLDAIPDDSLEWFYLPSTRLSMILGVLGSAGFLFALGLLDHPRDAAAEHGHTGMHDRGLWVGGWILMLVSIAAAAVVVVQSGGSELFSMTYLEFRRQFLRDTWLPNMIELSQLGCLLAMCGSAGRDWRWPALVWGGVIAIPMLVIGSRATAMIPLVVFAVALSNRGVHFRRMTIAVTVLAVSFIVPAVYAYRNVGVGNRDLVNWTDVTPLDAVVEMGGSLQATRAYVDWIGSGDAYLLGASYWAPIDRQLLTRIVPGREPIEFVNDARIPLRLMDEREGAIGGSATGEAYYNFGPIGPALYYAAIGLVFAWLHRRAHTPYGNAILGVAMLVFYFNIRSDSLAVPSQLAQALLIVFGCHLAGQLLAARGRPGAGARPVVQHLAIR
jgi:hypothetical protein